MRKTLEFLENEFDGTIVKKTYLSDNSICYEIDVTDVSMSEDTNSATSELESLTRDFYWTSKVAEKMVSLGWEAFREQYTSTFTIVTPRECIMSEKERAVPWFYPLQEADMPPFERRNAEPILRKFAGIGRATILYGTWDPISLMFFVEPDNLKAKDVLVGYFDIKPSISIMRMFMKIREKAEPDKMPMHLIYPKNLADDLTSEFVIADAEVLDLVIRDSRDSSKKRSIVQRLRDDIITYETVCAGARCNNATIRAKKGVTTSHPKIIEETQLALDELWKISQTYTKCDSKLGFNITSDDKGFSINEQRYEYTTNAIEKINSAIYVLRNKSAEKMVPLERVQTFGQARTCLMYLKEASDTDESTFYSYDEDDDTDNERY